MAKDDKDKSLAALQARRRTSTKSSSTPPLPKPKPKDGIDETVEFVKRVKKSLGSRKSDRRQSNIDKEDRKTSLSAARRAGHLYYWKNGKKMAAVTREDLKESGLGLTAFMNMQLGKTARKPKKALADAKAGARVSQLKTSQRNLTARKPKKSPPKKKSTEIKEMTPSTSRGLGSLASRRRKSKPSEIDFRKGGLLYGGKK